MTGLTAVVAFAPFCRFFKLLSGGTIKENTMLTGTMYIFENVLAVGYLSYWCHYGFVLKFAKIHATLRCATGIDAKSTVGK
jgi:hypothetical protein